MTKKLTHQPATKSNITPALNKDVWGVRHTADAIARASSILNNRPAMYLLD